MHTIAQTRTITHTCLTERLAGAWLALKLRQHARRHGTYAAARYARKTLGLPLDLALLTLARKAP